jgi:hypothetical protein
LFFGFFGWILSAIFTVLVWAFFGWVFYLVLKAIAPDTAARLRELITGRPG